MAKRKSYEEEFRERFEKLGVPPPSNTEAERITAEK